MSHNQNIARIRAVHEALGDLAHDVVFVGGVTVSLYTDRLTSDIRPTDDVDIVVELASYPDYAKVEEKLRAKGFVNDIESGVICRYKINGITVDVLPTEEDVLGFNNKWYPEAFKNAITKDLGNGCDVNIFDAVYFLATKMDAFSDRGNGDGRTSSDFEDVVFVLNNRRNIWNEIEAASAGLKEYLKSQFEDLFANDVIYEWVSSHLEHHEQKRTDLIITGLSQTLGIG